MHSDPRHMSYRKIPKISPGAFIFQRPFLKGLYSEGLMYGGKFALKSRLCQLIVGRKFTIFSLFYFVFEGTVFKYKPLGGLYSERPFNGGFFVLPVWGAYVWRGLFSEFYSIFSKQLKKYSSEQTEISNLYKLLL